ncbi:MAG: hypothetical protein WBI40_09410 [Methylococcaceae bacterium]
MFKKLLLVLVLISTPVFAENSPEYNLAVINAGGHVKENDITIARFRSLLNQLTVTYVENDKKIADMSVHLQQQLKNEGINESLINIMEGMNLIFVKNLKNQSYAEYAAAYQLLRTKGMGHDEAIRGLRGLIGGLSQFSK